MNEINIEFENKTNSKHFRNEIIDIIMISTNKEEYKDIKQASFLLMTIPRGLESI